MPSSNSRALLLSAFLGFAAFAITSPSRAAETPIDAAPMEGKKIRFDGLLKEWPQAQRLGVTVSGSATKAEGVVGYDDDHLYVAMRVEDDKLVRTGSFGAGEDFASLIIAFPSGGGHKAYEVKLYPGEPGKSTGVVKVDGVGKVSGSEIIEAPFDRGFSFEAKIPWSTFGEAKRVRSGMRGGLRYKDVDPGGKTSIVATSKELGSNLPPLTIEAEYALNRALVFPKGLPLKPNRLIAGNVVGDAMQETIAVYDRYLAITGFHYRGGAEFYYQDMNLSPSGLQRFDLEDVTGDGRDELVIRRRVGSSGDSHDYFEIWTFASEKDAPAQLFQHEVGFTKGSGHVHNDASLSQEKGKWSVTIAQGKPEGVDPETWDGPTISGDRAALMPWETVKSRRYEWSGMAFTMVEEEEWTPKMKSPSRGGGSTSRPATGDPIEPDESRVAPPPRPPNSEELMDQVYALYRTERGVKKSKPRFDFVTDVAGTEENERVLVHGKDIVVFGKKFKLGTSYVYGTIGVKEPEHILSVTARDVTGDGRADIIVRGIIPVQASKQLGGDIVTRHALLIYRVSEGAITRVFAAETGRSLEDNAILGRVSFVPVADSLRIELHPGQSVGWDEKSYPFPQDKLPYQGLEPLLLPWTDMKSRVYVYESENFRLVE